MSFLVAIDGPDGAGKTTLTASLSSALGFQAIKTPAREFCLRRCEFDRPGVVPIDRFRFYAAGLTASCAEAEGFLRRGVGVVADRYTYSLELHHAELDWRVDFHSLMHDYKFCEPRVQLILTADLEVLQERINQRGSGRSDSWLERDADYLGRVLKRFRSVSGPGVIHIDTGNQPAAATLALAEAVLEPLYAQQITATLHVAS